MRATVVTASLRRTQPSPAKGTNQIEVPRKNTAKKSTAAATLAASAARTPAATNGGHRLTPVKKPKTAAPEMGRAFAEPMFTSSELAQELPQAWPTAYAQRSNTHPSER